MKICSACGHTLTPDGPCGFASVPGSGRNLCHADDHWCGVGITVNKPLPDVAEGTGETGCDCGWLDCTDDSGEASPASDAVRDLTVPSSGPTSSRPSPGADVRRAVLHGWWFVPGEQVVQLLAELDEADKAAGIVRVDTRDEVTYREFTLAICPEPYHIGKPEHANCLTAAGRILAGLAALRGGQ